MIARGASTSQITRRSWFSFLTLLQVSGVVSITLLSCGYSFLDLFCVREMAEVVEVAASAPSTPTHEVVDLTRSPKKRSNPQSLNSILSAPLPPSCPISKFCLERYGYREIYHPDLKRILPVQGVDEWGSLFEVDADGDTVQSSKDLYISLVGFNMQNKITQNKEFLENCRDVAKGLIKSMFCTLFENTTDHDSIAYCLHNYPTWAIFAGKKKGKTPLGATRADARLREAERAAVGAGGQAGGGRAGLRGAGDRRKDGPERVPKG